VVTSVNRNGLLVKPHFDSGSGGGALVYYGDKTPSGLTIKDPDGNVVDQIQGGGQEGNEGYKYPINNVGQYGQGYTIDVNYSDGTSQTHNLQGGDDKYYFKDENNPNPTGSGGGGGGGGGGSLEFTPINVPNLPLADYKKVNPLRYAQKAFKSNLNIYNQAFEASQDLIKRTSQSEFDILKSYYDRANPFLKTALGEENKYN